MGDKILLGILQIYAVAMCWFGMRYLSTINYSWYLYIYDVLWFGLALISNGLGLLAMGKAKMTINSSNYNNLIITRLNVLTVHSKYFTLCFAGLAKQFGEQDRKVQWTMQHHFLFAWLAIVVGYPCIVTHSWMAYYQSPIAHVIFFFR